MGLDGATVSRIGRPSVDSVEIASAVNVAGAGVYAKGQKSLRDFFEALGVMA